MGTRRAAGGECAKAGWARGHRGKQRSDTTRPVFRGRADGRRGDLAATERERSGWHAQEGLEGWHDGGQPDDDKNDADAQ